MIAHLKGREKGAGGLRLDGTPRRMDRPGLSTRRCLHPGAVDEVLGCHIEKVRRAVHALIAQGVAAEENPPGITGIGRVCRIHGQGIYRALGAEDIRHRQIASAEVLTRRVIDAAGRPAASGTVCRSSSSSASARRSAGVSVGMRKPATYQFDGRSRPGNCSASSSWPAQGPTRSSVSASTSLQSVETRSFTDMVRYLHTMDASQSHGPTELRIRPTAPQRSGSRDQGYRSTVSDGHRDR